MPAQSIYAVVGTAPAANAPVVGTAPLAVAAVSAA